jgi:NADP-dependent 3-hydroxy acid dehydrogenase YdfG
MFLIRQEQRSQVHRRTHARSIRIRHFLPRSNRGPALQAAWSRVPITAKPAIEARAVSTDEALITGGDSGIGRAAAIAYAREGADVAIVYFPAEEPDAHEVIQIIRAAGRKAIALPGDIRDEAFCQALVEQAVSGLGGLDILVSNAGRQQSHDSILDISTEQFDWTLRTNLYAMFWITKAAIPHMPPGSAIIYTSSVNAYDPSVNLLDYAMTKAPIANFSKGLSKQMIKRCERRSKSATKRRRVFSGNDFWATLEQKVS